ncbi:hsp70 nucleotide exchange factor fes1 [Thoreauomyces humboldtii]|nr:hsp70 nucleotide exchange factor fes1 [Thoreauomyces humboldtii]
MSGAPTTSELLQWSSAHSTPGAEPPVQREPIDPKWLEVIMGKEDSARMKDCMVIISDTSISIDEREAAFDEFEMLVESLDNANDLRPLKLWKPLLDILSSDAEPKMRMFAAWVMGTAVQNNPKAQDDFIAAGGLEPILNALKTDKDAEVRAKAMHCISSTIRQSPKALEAFTEKNGMATLVSVVMDGDARLLKRAMFLIRSLVEEETPEVAEKAAQAAQENNVPDMAVDLLMSETQDLDLVEKCLQLLAALATKYPDTISPDLRERIRDEALPLIRRNFGTDDAIPDELLQQLQSAL